MSNLVRTMEKRKNAISPADIKMASAMNGTSKMSIDFGSKTLNGALHIKVPTNEFKICDGSSTVNDTPIAFTSDDDPSNYGKLLEFLDSLESNFITRVILDNVTDFKIMALDEFRNKVALEIDKRHMTDLQN